MISRSHCALALFAALSACQNDPPSGGAVHEAVLHTEPLAIAAGKPVDSLPGERWFRNVRQLTFGGENAEAYWSGDGTRLILQSTRSPYQCDQIFVIDLATGAETLVSTGQGRTTCAYFMQGDHRILYASTHLADANCPAPVMRHQGRYVWAIYDTFDIFTAMPDGSDLTRITNTPGYDAEATVCPVTGRLVFTSVRDGDLEVYSMEPDGSDVRRLTDRVGYDGGPFYSHDGTKIVLRSGFPTDEADAAEYRSFLQQGLVVPSSLEITLMDRDGGNFRKVTNNGKANFAPYFHPDNQRILFSSNCESPDGRDFDIFMINEDGTGQVRITNNPSFDGFPMFSPDGRFLVFASNRYAQERGETNIFVAEWVETPSTP